VGVLNSSANFFRKTISRNITHLQSYSIIQIGVLTWNRFERGVT